MFYVFRNLSKIWDGVDDKDFYERGADWLNWEVDIIEEILSTDALQVTETQPGSNSYWSENERKLFKAAYGYASLNIYNL